MGGCRAFWFLCKSRDMMRDEGEFKRYRHQRQKEGEYHTITIYWYTVSISNHLSRVALAQGPACVRACVRATPCAWLHC